MAVVVGPLNLGAVRQQLEPPFLKTLLIIFKNRFKTIKNLLTKLQFCANNLTKLRKEANMSEIAKYVAKLISDTNDVVSHQVIANKVLPLLPQGHHVTVNSVHGWVSKARFELEATGEGTIVNHRGFGFRFVKAQSRDITIFAAQHVKRTIMYADRANRLAALIDDKYMPLAIEAVFSKASDRIGKLAGVKKQFLLTWNKMRKSGAGQIKEPKQITEEKEKEHGK